MSARRTCTAVAALCLGLTACGHPRPAPEEVTTTVTEGDEQAWSEPSDPPALPDGDETVPEGADAPPQ